MRDANVKQVEELRAFARAASNFGQDMSMDCRRGANECEEAYRAANFFRRMAEEKVRAAEQRLYDAEATLAEYESRDHTDSEGRDHYDPAVAAALRANVQEARLHLNEAKDDERIVQSYYILVRQKADVLSNSLIASANHISSAASRVYSQVSTAADDIEHYNSVY